jgi:DNA-binding CsgD family transcriptional regulator
MQPVFDRAPAEGPAATLTGVEREVAGLIADGLTNQKIADRLGLARVTVSEHVATILWRLGLRSRHEIAAWAIAQARPAALDEGIVGFVRAGPDVGDAAANGREQTPGRGDGGHQQAPR